MSNIESEFQNALNEAIEEFRIDHEVETACPSCNKTITLHEGDNRCPCCNELINFSFDFDL